MTTKTMSEADQRKRRPLTDFFGILSEEEGQLMLDDLKKHKEEQRALHKERLKRLGF